MNWLAELKKLKTQTEPFDVEAAQKLLADTLTRLNEQYPFSAIQWAQAHRPELWESCQLALAQVEAAFKAQDMAAVRRAVTEFERANLALFKEYPGLPWQPGQKGTGGKVWELTDQQAQELGAIFAIPGVVERKGARWYSPEAWLEYTGQVQESRIQNPRAALISGRFTVNRIPGQKQIGANCCGR